MINLTLPYPPTVNHYWKSTVKRVAGNKGRVITRVSDEGKAFAEQVFWLVREQKAHKNLKADLKLVIHVYVPDRRRRDIDNLSKSLFDAMQKAGVYEDDTQIKDFRMIHSGIVKGGKVTLSIEEI
jgi:crossover junction endodeoxyribonuclease RusA